MDKEETIVAIATPLGSGGIGIIRMSGTKAKSRLKALFSPASSTFKDFLPWTLHRGFIHNKKGEQLDDILAVYMPGPKTFTGEDVVELHCHGGHVLLTSILEVVLEKGIRLANQGEFSYRAFLNGRIDLTQAEAISELISASSLEEAKLASNRLKGLMGRHVAQLRERMNQIRSLLCLAIDFSEEEIEDVFTTEKLINDLESIRIEVKQFLDSFERTKCWREGLVVALVGLVNAGKSSVFNALLGRERAIVTSHPGTTRDFLEEIFYISGLPIRIIDTAGQRVTFDPIENMGIQVGKEKAYAADIILLVIDSTQGITEEIKNIMESVDSERTILVWNKIDLEEQSKEPMPLPLECSLCRVCISAQTGYGINELVELIHKRVFSLDQGKEPKTGEIVPNIRQAGILSEVLKELSLLILDFKAGIPYDLCSVRLESIDMNLGLIIGSESSEDILNKIFASFCIGK